MRAGLLRQIITIESFTDSRNEYGEQIKSWSTFATIRAQVMPAVGQEVLAARQLMANAAVRIRARYLAGVNTRMRVLHGSTTMEIRSVTNMGSRGREMELLCEVVDGSI